MKNTQDQAEAKPEANGADSGEMAGYDRAAEPLSLDITTSAGGGPFQQPSALQPPPGVPKDPRDVAQEPEA